VKKLSQSFIQNWITRFRRTLEQRYSLFSALQPAIPKILEERLATYLMRKAGEGRRGLHLKLVAIALMPADPENADLSSAISTQFDKSSIRFFQYRVGDRLVRCRLYGQRTEGFLKRSCHANREWNATFRYVDYVCQVFGYKHKEATRLGRRMVGRRFIKSATRAQKVRAITILLRQGQETDAKRVYDSLSPSYTRSGLAPVFLQRNAFKAGWQNSQFMRRGSEQYRNIIRHRVSFRQMLMENKDSFCVVGNGPSEIGSGNGAVIDRHAVVIRFNRYDLSRRDDYGTKQSVWVRVPNAEAQADHIHSNDFLILASNNFEYKRADSDRYLLDAHLLDKCYTTIPPQVFRDLIDELGCLPSTGLAMLYWIYTIVGHIPKERVFGFSHIGDHQDFRSHYYKDSIDRKHHIHAWEKEIELINRIVI
jgi:Glycosyltransferase family 29 (sialyltransferase)